MSEQDKQDSGLSRFLRAVRWAVYLGVAVFVIVTVALWLGENDNREHISLLLPDGDNKKIMLFALMCAVSLACAGVALALLQLAEKLPVFVWGKAAAIPWHGRWALVVLAASIAGFALLYHFDKMIEMWSKQATDWLNMVCQPSRLQCGNGLDSVILIIRRIPVFGVCVGAAWLALVMLRKPIRKFYEHLRDKSREVQPTVDSMVNVGFLAAARKYPLVAVWHFGGKLLGKLRKLLPGGKKQDRTNDKKEDASGETSAEIAVSHPPALAENPTDSQSPKERGLAKVYAVVRDKLPFKKKKRSKLKLKKAAIDLSPQRGDGS